MGERLVCNQEVDGSNPFTSTTLRPAGFGWQATRKRTWAKECPPKPWRRGAGCSGLCIGPQLERSEDSNFDVALAISEGGRKAAGSLTL